MSIYDPGMAFENMVNKYWGQPTLNITYANLYGEGRFTMEAILFSIVYQQEIYHKSDYTPDEVDYLKEYISKFFMGADKPSLAENNRMVKFLLEHKIEAI